MSVSALFSRNLCRGDRLTFLPGETGDRSSFKAVANPSLNCLCVSCITHKHGVFGYSRRTKSIICATWSQDEVVVGEFEFFG